MNSILDHHLISQRYFFPRQDQPADPFWVDCGDARLACVYHEVSPLAKTIVHFHGNGEVVADYLDGFTELLGRMGCNCLLVEFRGYGGSSGQPQLGRMLDDVTTVIDAIGKPG
jgi:pimeloyl-ACP methyl ester carboxylesterase